MEKKLLTFDKKGFYLNGEKIRIFSGDIHYFRLYQTDWDRRLSLAVDMGLNAVQIYVPWNVHEPEEEKYCFDGMFDVVEFIKKCEEHNLYVLFRPSPYICSEWDFGGFPYWLLNKDVDLRVNDEKYLYYVKRYYDVLMPKIIPYLSTNGGPIIAVAVENEYGSYGNDREYIENLAKMIKSYGVDVPLYATDGDIISMIECGKVGGGFHGVNFSGEYEYAVDASKHADDFLENSPFFSGEMWVGRPMLWGEKFLRGNPKEKADGLKAALDRGCNVNMYMFSGGTNFGFYGGANHYIPFNCRPGSKKRYTPRMTSYDADAPVYEDGTVGEKYYLFRDLIDSAKGNPIRERIPFEHKVQIPQVKLTYRADFFENLDNLTTRKENSFYPLNMEKLNQDFGLMVYSLEAKYTRKTAFVFNPKDRAIMFSDNKFVASFMRDRGMFTDTVESDEGRAVIGKDGENHKINVICENLGRINFGIRLKDDRKGISGVCTGERVITGYENRSVPLKDLTKLKWKQNEEKCHKHRMPVFYKGEFEAAAGIDAYVDTHGFDHGYIWINGFNLGRYDCAGPQYSLYVPGGLLNQGKNTLTVLDLSPYEYNSEIRFADSLMLEGTSEEMK